MKVSFENPALAVIGCLLAAAAILAAHKSRGPKTLFILRVAAAILAAITAAEPVITLGSAEAKRKIAVLADVSDSMFLSGRIRAIESWLKANYGRMETHWDTELFVFDERLRSVKPGAKLSGKGGTDITGSISEAVSAGGARKPDGILLFSDGVETAGGRERRPATAEAARQTPVFAFDISGREDVRDVSIAAVRAPDFTFKGAETPVAAIILCRGFAGTQAEVVIYTTTTGHKETGAHPQPIARRRIMLREGENEVFLSFAPEVRGKMDFRVSVSTFYGEITHANNAYVFSTEALRDKIRVLYLCGRPSYEYSFLREFLKNDFAIELVTFVILRNPENVALVPDEELSLIPFPGADVLMKELGEFDLVIFENFTFERFGIYSAHFETLKKWVGEGGAFLMIGGENSFSAGNYARTPVRDILPVILEGAKDAEDHGVFAPVITDLSSRIFHTDSDRAEFWKNLPKLDWLQILEPHPDAQVILSHTSARAQKSKQAAPVLAVRRYQKGRTAALATNSTWRWKIGAPPCIYDTFWKNLVSWLVSSDEDDVKTAVVGLKESATAGENATFLVRKTSPGTAATVFLISPDGRRIPLEGRDEGGFIKFSFIPGAVGRHSLEINLTGPGVRPQGLSVPLQVRSFHASEGADLRVNVEFLRTISESTGGSLVGKELFLSGDFDLTAEIIEERLKTVAIETAPSKEIRPSSSVAAFAALAILIIAELAARRRKYGLW